MKIVWRNPNPISRTSFSIVKTLDVERPDELRMSYRSSRGPGALGTIFELRLNRDAVSPVPHNPSVNHLVSLECQPAAMRDSRIREMLHSAARRSPERLRVTVQSDLSRALASRREQQERIAIKTQSRGVVRKDVCFAALEVAVERYRFRRDFLNSPARVERKDPAGTILPTPESKCQCLLR
jgi:hypothetical protein